MVLKPSKCFLVVTCVELTEEIKHAIRAWLTVNIPEWANFKIVSAGKYLGTMLGRNCRELTFNAPITKYARVCTELAEAKAPTLPTLLRYKIGRAHV